MNKRMLISIYFALALISGRALFLLLMAFLSIGGTWILLAALLTVSFTKGVRSAFIWAHAYGILVLALWISNAFYAPYPAEIDYTDYELIRLCETLISYANESYTSEFNEEQILKIVPSVMETCHSCIKYSQSPNVMNSLNLSGIFIPFTGHSIVNESEHGFLLPFISAHELAHREGILNEGQANMHAYVRCMSSGDPSFQYSASVYALKYAMNELQIKSEAEYNRLVTKIIEKVQCDLRKMSVSRSDYSLWDYASFISCLIYDQSMTSQGVI